MYPLVRKILFLFGAEKAHYIAMSLLQLFCKIGVVKKWLSSYYTYHHTKLEQKFWGLHFKNPVGLGAGFDKNAKYLSSLECLGFGFVEIGTVTPKPQDGNTKPRLFRLPKDEALINRMGFNNDGVEVVAKRLEKFRQDNLNTTLIIGGNIGKNKTTPNDDAWKDYETCFIQLYNVVDYFVVNVSSPNTPGLRELQEKPMLTKIFNVLQAYNLKQQKPKPLLLKIAPDLSSSELDDIIALAIEMKLDGLVISNTTISRDGLTSNKQLVEKIGSGGLSGKPLQRMSNDVLKYVHLNAKQKIVLIGSGGIFTSNDAINKIQLGANLLQVWTGFIYQGPSIVKNICNELVKI